MRPIDADALLDALYDNEFQTFCPLDEVCGVIDAAPTLDCEPVRHGEWIMKSDDNSFGVCSCCNRSDHIDPLATHCRYCGAKMDGGK